MIVNCQLEFNFAALKKGNSKMVPVVMEPSVRNTKQWRGMIDFELSGLLYVDMAEQPLVTSPPLTLPSLPFPLSRYRGLCSVLPLRDRRRLRRWTSWSSASCPCWAAGACELSWKPCSPSWTRCPRRPPRASMHRTVLRPRPPQPSLPRTIAWSKWWRPSWWATALVLTCCIASCITVAVLTQIQFLVAEAQIAPGNAKKVSRRPPQRTLGIFRL